MKNIAIFSGNASKSLTRDICDCAGVPLGNALVSAFSDGETRVQIQENVRGLDCYVVQSTGSPANQNIMELLIMVDALRRASAGSITAVIPYFGYGRQERKDKPRTPITAKLVADLLVAAGVTRVVSIDLHAGPIQGFFNIPFDHLYAKPVLLPYLAALYDGAVVVTPDAGGFERARSYSKGIPGSTIAAIDKRRERPNESEVMNVVGEVKGKRCLIIDDMIDTAGTLVHATEALLERGALSVSACATHGVLSGPASTRLLGSNISEVIFTNTLAVPATFEVATQSRCSRISIAPLLASAIRSIHNNESVSSLFS